MTAPENAAAPAYGAGMPVKASKEPDAVDTASQRESEHLLTAAEVADAQAYFAQFPDYYGLQLVAQDGRWRALVGDLLTALAAAEGEGQLNSVVAHWQGHAGVTWLDPLGPASQRALAALRQAQAALDGAA